MRSKYIFCIQILIFLTIYFLIFYSKDLEKVTYKLKNDSLENFQSLNIPCISCVPSLWELEQISGLNLTQSKQIQNILITNPYISKKDFKAKLMEIKGIGKKKSNKISKLFYY